MKSLLTTMFYTAADRKLNTDVFTGQSSRDNNTDTKKELKSPDSLIKTLNLVRRQVRSTFIKCIKRHL